MRYPCRRFGWLLGFVLVVGTFVPEAMAAAPPVNTAPPVLGGNLVEGGRLTAHPGTWSGLKSVAYDYQWQRCDSPDESSCVPAGTSGVVHPLTSLDVQKWFRLTATATNGLGFGTAVSAVEGPVVAPPILPSLQVRNVSPPVISGQPVLGDLLDASEGIWYAPPETTFRFQWSRCTGSTCVPVPGAVAPVYVLTPDDVGKQLEVRVWAVTKKVLLDPLGVPSDPTLPIEPSAVCDTLAACSPSPCEPPYYKPGTSTVTLFAPAIVRQNGADLRWTGTAGQTFRGFEVHRSLQPAFVPGPDTRIATFNDPAASSYSDRTAWSNARYYYKVVMLTSCADVWSEEQFVDTPLPGQTTRIFSPGSGGRAATIYLRGDDSTSSCKNTGTDQTIVVGTESSAVYRSLLRFELNRVPTGVRILDATIVLWAKSLPASKISVVAQRVTRDWQEGSGTFASATCTRDGASWQEAAGNQPWTSAGGDFDTDELSSFQTDLGQPSQTFSPAAPRELPVTGLVSSWVDGEFPNYGVLLKADTEPNAAGRSATFWSDDRGTGAQPALVVTYADPVSDAGNQHQAAPLQDPPAAGATLDAFNDPNAMVQVASQPAGGEDSMRARTAGCPQSRPPFNPGPVVVCVSQTGKNVTFWNDETRATIYFDCIGPSQRGGADRTVGPGYVARLWDTRDATHPVKLVEGEQRQGTNEAHTRPHFQDAGGLGLFGWHHARGEPNTLRGGGPANQDRGGNQIRDIDGRLCAEEPAVGQWGVLGTRLLNPPPTNAPPGTECHGPDLPEGGTDPDANWWTPACSYVNTAGVGVFDMEVTFRDAWQGPGSGEPLPYVMKVTYRWRFRSEGFKMFAAVEPTATTIEEMDDPYCVPVVKPPCNQADTKITGVPFVKEPKFGASFLGASNYASGPVWTRMGVFTQGEGRKGWARDGSMRGETLNSMNTETLKTDKTERARVRWDFITAPTVQAAAAATLRKKFAPCPASSSAPSTPACFSVVMREMDASKILAGGAALQAARSDFWLRGSDGGLGYGLDQWAVDEGHIEMRARDADSDEKCNAGPPEGPINDPRLGSTTRTWEFVGRKNLTGVNTASDPELNNNPKPFLQSAVLFLGWAGGNGPTDCEALLRAFPTEGREQQAPSCTYHQTPGQPVVCRYGTFASFGLNDTFPRMMKAQTGDTAQPK